MLLLHAVFFLSIIYSAAAKPISEKLEQIVPRYEQLENTVDNKYVEPAALVDIQTALTDQPVTTAIVDSKIDDDVEDDSPEEDEERLTKELVGTTRDPRRNQSKQKLEVEEQETVFNEEQEIVARKPAVAQIIRTVNTAPTILPQTSSVSKPTQSEPSTTPFHRESPKGADHPTGQKPTSLPERPPKATATEVPKTLTKLKDEQPPSDTEYVDENQRMLNHNRQQQFEPKDQISQGAIIYGGQVPALQEKLPIGTTETPVEREEAAAETPSTIKDNNWVYTLVDAVRCIKGSCANVLVPTTPIERRELKPPTIIRRARRSRGIKEQEGIVLCKCVLGR